MSHRQAEQTPNVDSVQHSSTRTREGKLFPPQKCLNCPQRNNKLYCYTCNQFFCERCFLSTHLFQFNHSAIILPNWTGHPKFCHDLQCSHFFVHCTDCDQVCMFILIVMTQASYFLIRLSASSVQLLSTIKVIAALLIITHFLSLIIILHRRILKVVNGFHMFKNNNHPHLGIQSQLCTSETNQYHHFNN